MTAAEVLINAAYQLSLELGDIGAQNWTMLRMGFLARDRGDFAQAYALFAQYALVLRDQLKLGAHGFNVYGFASVASAVGEPVRATRLFGACDAYNERVNFQLFPVSQLEYEPYITAAREQLGEAAFAAAWAEGRLMSLEQAIAYALGESP